jgi:hypothetical protein
MEDEHEGLCVGDTIDSGDALRKCVAYAASGINDIGLNRYAVLGRSSRLWPCVVPDQAFLFAILSA